MGLMHENSAPPAGTAGPPSPPATESPRRTARDRPAQRLIAASAAALALLTAVRLVVAARIPLAPDEAYYWVWSRALAPGYFDHPPMVALWIRAGTAVAGDTALGVRLLGPLAAALGSVLVWDACGRLLPRPGAGLAAAWLLNATLVVGAGAILATPDAPLLLFWTAALWALARIAAGGAARWWLAAGLFVGLAAASKYTAVLLALAIGTWLALAGRPWLRRREPWVGAALALIVVAPVVWWNAAHQWVSFLKQGGRAGAWSPERAPQYLLELVGGQIGIATPLIFVLLTAGMAVAIRAAWRTRDPAWTLLAAFGGVPALVFVQHAIGDRVQTNWPVVLYPAAAIAAAGLCRQCWQGLRLPAIALGLTVTGAVYAQALFAPFALPPRLDPVALQTAGWQGFATAVENARRKAGASFVAAGNYGLAAELARGLPAGVPVVAVGPRWSSFALERPAIGGQTGLLVQPDHTAPIWRAAQAVGLAAREQNGLVIRAYRLYRAVAEPGTSIVLLPRPTK
jgi:4-amino-4-deoxy-L-arabinose transferase-like glycosyltransferase